MPKSTHYFTSMPYLMERFERFGRRLGFRAGAPEEARAWQHELRARVRELLGLNTMLSCPLNPRVTERESGPGYVRERVELQTEPGVTMPLYVLLPEKLTPGERRPAILAPHGHGSGGKLSPAGREDLPAIRPQIELYNYAYGVQFAQAGWIAFCPDARGFGERRESTVQGDEGLVLLGLDPPLAEERLLAVDVGRRLTPSEPPLLPQSLRWSTGQRIGP